MTWIKELLPTSSRIDGIKISLENTTEAEVVYFIRVLQDTFVYKFDTDISPSSFRLNDSFFLFVYYGSH